ncbi:hypothetical protein BWQ96_07259 [Gracilariopsis chorda]|uniref:Uncharacterized protein n=1 Tax=Gracilariopsis chorda TaxID=448386 RepID=A0A2V3ILP8_9FLOR|nr:hypothetical protein BWQ96_07259 [Gracilariopsis chorda]|eukprot:PXF43011.1 hypothetical protein BWQ96_07259 [Gracilariopsis chorda]
MRKHYGWFVVSLLSICLAVSAYDLVSSPQRARQLAKLQSRRAKILNRLSEDHHRLRDALRVRKELEGRVHSLKTSSTKSRVPCLTYPNECGSLYKLRSELEVAQRKLKEAQKAESDLIAEDYFLVNNDELKNVDNHIRIVRTLMYGTQSVQPRPGGDI